MGTGTAVLNSYSSSEGNATAVSLKRKRPPKIEIPNVLGEIRPDKLRELTPRTSALLFCENGVGLSSVKGKKKFMEDTHKILPRLPGHPNKVFFGVYDGHGGRKAAEFVAENLHNNILEKMESCRDCKTKEQAVKAGYLKTDQDFLKLGIGSGACCVTALIQGLEVVISNLGDCRAVLSRGGMAEALTKDHRAEQEEERQRIEGKGGYVENHRGAWRVHGVLSVSRSIGDAHLKDWLSAEPDIKILDLTSDMEFLILASDGLWEKVGNQEAINIATRFNFVDKKLAQSGNLQKVTNHGHNDPGYVSVSPPSKLRMNSLASKVKLMSSRSLNYKKTAVNKWKDGGDGDDYGCENESPPSKSGDLKKVTNLENEDPGHMNVSPPKLRMVSLTNKVNLMSQSPSCKKTANKWAEGGDNDDYGCGNKSPPSKLQRISLDQRLNMKATDEWCAKGPSSSGLAAACKELVDLALSRGSLDDITVMIIDLDHFRSRDNKSL